MLALIVAYAKNRVIGKDGKIPWNIEGEKARFKQLTTGNVVIMGRKTFEEIGKPLPGRDTIVISNTKKYEYDHCKTASYLGEALRMAEGRDVFIAGGARLYEEALPLVDIMYITKIDAIIEGDTYFPVFPKELFKETIEKRVSGKIPYEYVTYRRIAEEV